MDSPDRLASAVRRVWHARAIKLKLDGSAEDLARVLAVRLARPDADLYVDANQGWSDDHLRSLLPAMRDLGVKLVEQPLRVGADWALRVAERCIPFAADESLQDLADLSGLRDRYDVVNIKLDKCGGLTRGLQIAAAAREAGFSVMVGCMGGTSLAMAPAAVLGQLCDIVDLDAPTFLALDRTTPVSYRDGLLHCPAALWGNAAAQPD